MAETVLQFPFLQYLQKQVEHVGMSFFDFVQQNHGIRTLPDLFRVIREGADAITLVARVEEGTPEARTAKLSWVRA